MYIDVFFLNINSPVAEIGSQSLHFSRGQDGCFLNSASGLLEYTSYVITVGKLAITNNVTFSFVDVSILDVLASQ